MGGGKNPRKSTQNHLTLALTKSRVMGVGRKTPEHN